MDDHQIRILVRLREDVTKGFKKMGLSADDFANHVNKANNRIADMRLEMNKASGSTKNVDRDYNRLRHSVSALGSNLRSLGRDWNNNSRAVTTFRNKINGLRRVVSATGDDVGKLERRFALLGRAMLGLAIGTVLVFVQSFASALVALGGQAVALAGSLSYAASAIVGSFIPAIAQAIPVVGLLAQAMTRLGIIQNAVTQHLLVQKQASSQLESQLGSETSAHNAVADAQRGVADAQRNLTQSRKDARRELEDLIMSEKEAELQARGATLAQSEAHRALQQAIQQGDVSAISGAQLDVDESHLQKQQSQLDLQRARSDAAQARRKGIEHMEQVTDATRALEDANRQLADSHEQAAQGAMDQSAAENYLQFYLDQLTPTEKKLYKRFLEFRHQVQRAFKPLTDIIFGSLIHALDRIEGLVLNNKIVDGFRNIAHGVADAIEALSKAFTNKDSRDFWENTLKDAATNLKPITRLFVSLWHIFKNLSEGAAPVLRSILHDIVGLLHDFEDVTGHSNQVEKFFVRGLRHLRAWGRLLLSVVELFGALFGVSAHSALKTISSITKEIQKATDWLRENRTTASLFFNETATALSYLGDILVAIGAGLLEAFDPETVKAFRDLLVDVVIPAMVQWIQVTGIIAKLLDTLFTAPVLGDLAKFAFTVALTAGTLSLLIGTLKPLLALLKGLDVVLAGGAVTKWFTAMKESFQGLIPLAKGGATDFIEKLTGGIKSGGTKVSTAIKNLFTTAALRVKAFTSAAYDMVGTFVGGIASRIGSSKVGQRVTGAFSRVGRAAAVAMARVMIPIITGAVVLGETVGGITGGLFGRIRSKLPKMTRFFAFLGTRSGYAFAAAFVTLGAAYIYFLLQDDKNRRKFVDGGKIIGEAIGNGIIEALNQAFEEILEKMAAPPFGALLSLAGVDIVDIPDIPHISVTTSEEKQAQKQQEHQAQHQAQGQSTDVIDSPDVDGVKAYEKALRQAAKEQEHLGNETHKTKKEQKDFGDETDKTKKKQKNQEEGTVNLIKKFGKLIKTLAGTGKTSRGMGQLIGDVTNKILKSFGADELKFVLPSAGSLLGTATSLGSSLLGIDGGQSGGYFGSPTDRGPDDRLIKVAGGEAILTGHDQPWVNMGMAYANAAGVIPYGGLQDMFKGKRKPHATAPKGFAKGGMVDPTWDAGSEVINSQIVNTVRKWVSRYHADITAGYDPGGGHVSPGHNVTGTATDVVPIGGWAPSNTALFEKGLKILIAQGLEVGYGTDGIGLPWPNHGRGNHAHIEWIGNGSPGTLPSITGGGGSRIKKLRIKGPKGALRDALQGQANQLRKGANKYIAKKSQTNLFGVDAGGSLGSGALSEGEFLRVALAALRLTDTSKAFGPAFPATPANAQRLLSLAMQESSLNPGIQNTTDSNAAAGIPSGGLMQLIPPNFKAYHEPGTANSIFDPLANVAASINYQKARYGHLVTSSPYAYGGIVPYGGAFKQGGTVPGPLGAPTAILAHGGETVIPSFAGGGYVPPNINKEPNNLLKEIAKIIKGIGGLGGGKKGLDKLSKAVEDLAGDGGALDRLAEAIDKFVTNMSTKLLVASYDVNKKGVVSKVLTDLQISVKQLADLVSVGDILQKEIDAVKKAIKEVNKRLKDLKGKKNKDERQKLKATINDLELQLGELDSSFAENLQDRYEAQKQIIEDRIDKFNQTISNLDVSSSIFSFITDITGFFDESGQIGAQGQIIDQLNAQRDKIEEELKHAINRGDTDFAAELQGLLDENTQAILAATQQIFQIQRDAYAAAIESIRHQIGLEDLQQQILQLQGEISGTTDTGGIGALIQARGAELIKIRDRITQEITEAQARGDLVLFDELQTALLENEVAILENTKELKELNGQLGDPQSFTSSAWTLFRQAVFNGMGGLLPEFQQYVPQLASGGIVTKQGLFNLHAGEAVTSADATAQELTFNFTEPMEVADPTYLAKRIAFEMKTAKTV